MAGYIGTTPVPQATQHRESFTATGGQTSFATAGYTPQFIDVYLNGVKLAPADFTATNGSDVVLASGATASDILEIVAYTPFEVANQTFTGDTSVTNLAVTGTFTSRGIDDNADATAITIDSSENVGIGTSSPNRDLSVAGVISAQTSANDASILLLPTASENRIYSRAGDVSTTALDLTFRMGDTERMRIDSSGNVGIGTSSPASKLHIQATDTAGVSALEVARFGMNQISNYGDGVYSSYFYNTSTEGARIGMDVSISGGALYFSTGGSTERMRITSSGIMEFNTNAVISVNDTAGAMYIGGGGTLPNTIQNQASVLHNWQVAGSNAMRIDSSGNLLVGKTSADNTTQGIRMLGSAGFASFVRAEAEPIVVNRLTDDGDIVQFRKDGTTVGSIGVKSSNNLYIAGSVANHVGLEFGTSQILAMRDTATSDNTVDLGSVNTRFKDLYLSGGVFLGGTGSANKLDDYEEGTWTVTNAGDSTGTVSSNGRYVKIGRQVTCHATISVSNNFSSSSLGGLPFNPDHNNTLSAIHSAAVCVAGNVKMVSVNHASGNLTARDVNGGAVNPTASQIIRFTIVYQTT